MTTKRFTVTAIIYSKKGRVLSIGKNSYTKTHTYQAKIAESVGEPFKIFLHAEIHAITRLKDINKAYRISVFRYNADGNPVNAKPCQICAHALKQTPIKRIEHT